MVGSIKSIKFQLPRDTKGGTRAPRFRAPFQLPLRGCTKPWCTRPPLAGPREFEFYTFYITYHAFYTFFILFLYFFYTLEGLGSLQGHILGPPGNQELELELVLELDLYQGLDLDLELELGLELASAKMSPGRPRLLPKV